MHRALTLLDVASATRGSSPISGHSKADPLLVIDATGHDTSRTTQSAEERDGLSSAIEQSLRRLVQ